jgi:hypothetical protein
MKKSLFLIFLLLVAFLTSLRAQDNPKSTGAPKSDDRTVAVTPLRVQVVFTEYDGDKKVSSLPYSFTVNADERRARPGSQVRNGARIPVATGKDQFTYLDVGANIDCSATLQDDGRFKLMMVVERSFVSPDTPSANSMVPVVRQFKAEMNPVLKDGQTIESIVATDPLNGHVFHVNVTLNLAK